MSSKGSIVAGKGHVELGLKSDALEKGLASIEAKFQAWGKNVAALGAAIAAAGASITAPFLHGLSVFTSWGDEVSTVMRNTGMSFNDVDAAMDGTRAGAEEFTTAMGRMNEFIMAAASGSEEANRALGEMGLNVEQLQQATDANRLRLFADGLQRIGDVGMRFARQRDVFGRGGMGLNLTGGTQGMDARAARRDYIEGTPTDEDRELALATSRAYKEMGDAISAVWREIGAAAAPIMKAFYRFFTDIVVRVREFVTEHRAVFEIVFAVGVALTTLGTAITILGGIVYAASYAFAFANVMIGVTKAFLLGLWGVTLFAATGFGALKLSVLAFSAMATIGMVAAKGAMWLYTVATGAASIGTTIATAGVNLLTAALTLLAGAFVVVGLAAPIAAIGYAIYRLADLSNAVSVTSTQGMQMLAGLADTAVTAWGAIKAAFNAGEWELLWNILQTTVQLAWAQIVAGVEPIWNSWKDAAADTWTAMTDMLEDAFAGAWTAVEFAFILFTASIESGFIAMTNVIIGVVNSMIGAISQGMNAAIDMINTAIESLPESVRSTLGIDVMQRVSEAPAIGQVAGNEDRIRGALASASVAAEVAQQQRDQDRRVRDMFEQGVRQRRDEAAAAGNQAEVERLQRELAALREEAEGAEWWAWVNDQWNSIQGANAHRLGEGIEGAATAGGRSLIAGSSNASAIFGMLGAGRDPMQRLIDAEQRAANMQADANRILANVQVAAEGIMREVRNIGRVV